jgi:hypothetical protein
VIALAVGQTETVGVAGPTVSVAEITAPALLPLCTEVSAPGLSLKEPTDDGAVRVAVTVQDVKAASETPAIAKPEELLLKEVFTQSLFATPTPPNPAG